MLGSPDYVVTACCALSDNKYSSLYLYHNQECKTYDKYHATPNGRLQMTLTDSGKMMAIKTWKLTAWEDPMPPTRKKTHHIARRLAKSSL